MLTASFWFSNMPLPPVKVFWFHEAGLPQHSVLMYIITHHALYSYLFTCLLSLCKRRMCFISTWHSVWHTGVISATFACAICQLSLESWPSPLSGTMSVPGTSVSSAQSRYLIKIGTSMNKWWEGRVASSEGYSAAAVAWDLGGWKSEGGCSEMDQGSLTSEVQVTLIPTIFLKMTH